MGLFMGLGLIGAAFAIDGVKTHNAQLPYKKFERIDPFNEAKWRQAKKNARCCEPWELLRR